jgi:hypothetical protein
MNTATSYTSTSIETAVLKGQTKERTTIKSDYNFCITVSLQTNVAPLKWVTYL